MIERWVDLNFKVRSSLRSASRSLSGAAGCSGKDLLFGGYLTEVRFGMPLTIDEASVEQRMRIAALRMSSQALDCSIPPYRASARVLMALGEACLDDERTRVLEHPPFSVAALRHRCLIGMPLNIDDLLALANVLQISTGELLWLALEDLGYAEHLKREPRPDTGKP